jgi:hypothetical protein
MGLELTTHPTSFNGEQELLHIENQYYVQKYELKEKID